METLQKSVEIFQSNTFYYQELITQINRDLERSGETVHFQSDITAITFTNQLKNYLTRLFESHPEKIHKILYIIDVPESWLSKYRDSTDYALSLTLLILQREWQKVIFRNQFKSEK